MEDNFIKTSASSQIKRILSIRKKEIELENQALMEYLRQAPDGKLLCTEDTKKGKTYCKWYQVPHGNHGKRMYISKENRELAEALAFKGYSTGKLKDNTVELKQIKCFLEKLNGKSAVEKYLERGPEYLSLLKSSRFTADFSGDEVSYGNLKEELREWSQAEYRSNPNHPEHLVCKTPNGGYVRSKSELFIATFLQMNHIPYRYEAELELGDEIIYPDFTIRHPKTGATVILEHFGLYDNDRYFETFLRKLRAYRRCNYIPYYNLLMTYETNDIPFDSARVSKMLEFYFLEDYLP